MQQSIAFNKQSNGDSLSAPKMDEFAMTFLYTQLTAHEGQVRRASSGQLTVLDPFNRGHMLEIRGLGVVFRALWVWICATAAWLSQSRKQSIVGKSTTYTDSRRIGLPADSSQITPVRS